MSSELQIKLSYYSCKLCKPDPTAGEKLIVFLYRSKKIFDNCIGSHFLVYFGMHKPKVICYKVSSLKVDFKMTENTGFDIAVVLYRNIFLKTTQQLNELLIRI